ncbi:MAG: hypothetical protein II225_01820, partial [Ruminococcus sp.]|nr:hypothetical protein [Ruminococcus sp.]
MSKFCSQCGSMMEDAQMFCGVCGAAAQAPQEATPQYEAPQYSAPQYGVPQQAPQQAPQYSAPQQAPQYSAPQYGAPQQAPQYGAPQYSAPQQAPQYGAPQYNTAPAENAFTKFFANLDWMGMLTGKATIFQNCIAALAVQFLSFIFFFLPMAKAGFLYVSDSAGLFKGFAGTAGILFPIVALLALLGGITFLVLPLFMKKEIKILNVLVFAAGQLLYFLMTVIGTIVLVAQINKFGLRAGVTIGFIMFVLFTLVALFVSGRILFFHKDEVFAVFKKPAGSVAANNVPTGYPTGNF